MDEFMQAAYDEACASRDEGGFPVGSVIVRDGQIVGAGRNRFTQSGDPTTHAEMEAIRDAAVRAGNPAAANSLEGATCYTTMMPCEMCAGALIRFGVARVVVAEVQSYVDAGTGPLLQRQGIEVEVRAEADCMALVESHFERHPGVGRRMRAARRRLKL